MCNLRQIDARSDAPTTGLLSSISMPQFCSVGDGVFGNFAEPLQHAASHRHEDDGVNDPVRVGDGDSLVDDLVLEVTEMGESSKPVLKAKPMIIG